MCRIILTLFLLSSSRLFLAQCIAPEAPNVVHTVTSTCGNVVEIQPFGSTGNYHFFSDLSGQNMIGIGQSFTTGELFGDTIFYVAAIPNPTQIVFVDTFSFSNCGKTGFSGPSQSDVNTAYANTNLAGQVAINAPGIQEWIVPISGYYRITAAGASGAVIGTAGEAGLGALVEGTFFLQAGEKLNIVVGQEGTANNNNGGGGGGGSFVIFEGASSDDGILVIAGGGGTCVAKPNNGIAHGKVTLVGTDGERSTGVYAGGFEGQGAEGQQNIAGGGGGFGGNAPCAGHPGSPDCGDAYNNTTNSDGIRGAGFLSTNSQSERANGGGARGGFGGGGGANTASLGRVGGGGGYSGGGAGFNGNGNPSCSGGGASFNAGADQNNIAGTNNGHGFVEIKYAEVACISELVAVNIFVNSLAPPTISGDAVVCQEQSVTLTASGSPDSYAWYDDPSGLQILDTGAVFVTPIITSNTTYYAQAIAYGLLDTAVYEFTNANQTGRFGPNQAAIDAAYAGTSLEGQVTISTPGIQEWTVPATGLYRITAAGASGAPIGSPTQIGRGAVMEGYFELTAGQIINIAVGQQGIAASPYGGGGGGTFVVLHEASSDDDILVIAGGGGSCFGKVNDGSADGQITTSGANGDRSTGVWAGGTDGSGGEGSQNTVGGGGGYGGTTNCPSNPGQPFCGDAYNGTVNSDNRRGAGFLSTAAQANRGDGGNTNGGFGGGGGYNGTNQSRIGGGGGYSGGGAGFTNTTSVCSGGGGSFNSGMNQNNIAGGNLGHGYVTIAALEMGIQCDSPLQPFQITYTNTGLTPTFEPVGPFCPDAQAPALPSTSNEGVVGTWSPATINTASVGTSNYTFTPTDNSCASPAVISVSISQNVTPIFSPIESVCQGVIAPELPTTSINVISGTWSPAVINTTNAGTSTYTFTPTPSACNATTASINVTVDLPTTPAFDAVDILCEGAVAPALQTTSNNGVSGTWSPAAINTNNIGQTDYLFTPNPGSCATSSTLEVTVNAPVTPAFNPIDALCQNSPAPALQGTSNNGISGTWNPAAISTSTVGTSSYSFTPEVNSCANSSTLSVTVEAQDTPTFTPIEAICEGSTAPSLPSTSNNGIAGTWTPTTINTSNVGTSTYTFTPAANVCATSNTLDVSIEAATVTQFDPIGALCRGDNAPTLETTSLNGITGTWNPPTINTSIVGTATHVFTPNSGQCATSFTDVITINSVNTGVTQNNETLQANQSGATYQWLDCNNSLTPIPGATNQTYVATQNGSYAVQITSNGCVDVSACLDVISLSLENFDEQGRVLIYPNPGTGIYFLEGVSSNELISVYTTSGELIQRFRADKAQVEINLVNQPKGIYFVEGTSFKLKIVQQ